MVFLVVCVTGIVGIIVIVVVGLSWYHYSPPLIPGHNGVSGNIDTIVIGGSVIRDISGIRDMSIGRVRVSGLVICVIVGGIVVTVVSIVSIVGSGSFMGVTMAHTARCPRIDRLLEVPILLVALASLVLIVM